MQLLSKIHSLEAQQSLLSETLHPKELLESKIISNVQPKFGKTQVRKQKVLKETRKKLIMVSIEDKEIQLYGLNQEFERKRIECTVNSGNFSSFLQKLETLMNAYIYHLTWSINKIFSFIRVEETY